MMQNLLEHSSTHNWEFSTNNFDVAIAASRLAWKSSAARMVDIATECLIDLATASRSLDRATPDIDSCWRDK